MHICMGLAANPDFQNWLARFAARHERLHAEGPHAPPGLCDGCGDELAEPPSSAPYCIVCLAEQYGRDRTQAAARVAEALRAAAVTERLPVSEVREAVEEVLEELELAANG
jgi:hypothetical protein